LSLAYGVGLAAALEFFIMEDGTFNLVFLLDGKFGGEFLLNTGSEKRLPSWWK
tara:strand:- start:242 stop:400 length:159 start_codon:yes stop_codon:yes gene_type:complete